MINKGFTLIEVIATLVIVGILSVAIIPYFQAGITRSADPLDVLPTPLKIQGIMSSIVSAYNGNPNYQQDLTSLEATINGNSNNPYGIDSSITVTINNQYKFKSTDTKVALKVTIKSNAGRSRESVTYIFTQKL